jgi:hypothetical protein
MFRPTVQPTSLQAYKSQTKPTLTTADTGNGLVVIHAFLASLYNVQIHALFLKVDQI